MHGTMHAADLDGGRHAEGVAPETVEDREPLSGLVERVAYHNIENGYCVLRAKLQIGVVASVPRCLVLQP